MKKISALILAAFSLSLLFGQERMSVQVLVPESINVPETEISWLPGQIQDKFKSNLQEYLGMKTLVDSKTENIIKKLQRDSENISHNEKMAIEIGKISTANFVLFSKIRKTNKGYIITLDFTDLTTGEHKASATSKEYSESDSLYASAGAVDELTVQLADKLKIAIAPRIRTLLTGVTEAKTYSSEKHWYEEDYGDSASDNPFENAANFFVNKSKGSMAISIEDINFEGKSYKALCISGSTGLQNANWTDWWGASCQSNSGGMMDFMMQGNNIKFKCIGDGTVWRMTLRLYDTEYSRASYFIYEFPTKNDKVSEITIPYSRFKFDSSVKRKFNKDEITAVELFAYNPGSESAHSIKIFDVKVY